MPRLRRSLPFLCLLALAACAGGTDEPSGPAYVAKSDLAIMVLPREELGPLATRLDVADDSGWTGNREAAHDTLDPADTAASLSERGRVAGYDLSYENPKLASLEGRKGLFGVSTSVELLRDDIYASEFLAKQAEDFERLEGTVGGVKVSGVSSFPVAGVGDEARGVRATAGFGGLRFHLTMALFRRGCLVGVAEIVRADRENVTADARRIARALDARIRHVLEGSVDGEPVALPAQERLDPRRLALTTGDLPPGAALTGQGRRRHGNVRSYVREFELRHGDLHGSQVAYVRAMAQVLDGDGSAAFFLRFDSTPKGGHALTRSFVRGVVHVDPRELRARILRRGSDTVGILASFDGSKGPVSVVMLVVRSGRAVGSVTALGLAADLDPDDVFALTGRVRARLGPGA